MQFDHSICKLCGGGGNTIRYRLRMANVVVCQHCGFHYTDYKDDEYAGLSAHSESTVLDEKAIRYIEEKLQSNPHRFDHHIATVLQYKQQGTLLDIGFGGALFLRSMLQQGFDAYGIELDKQYLLYAKEVLGLRNINNLPVQDAYWQDHYAGFFDVIVLWDVLEHVNDPVALMQSIQRLLKPGGYLFIDTPCRDGFYHLSGEWLFRLSRGRWKGLLHDLYSSHRFGHKQIFSKQDMRKLLTQFQLQPVSIQQFHEMSFPYAFYLKKILKRDWLVASALPLVKLFFALVKIRNKMMVISIKEI
ncbi:MAG: class I SAM-dependent methyltransferase [Chitinophagaceae bacterium]